MRVRELLPCQQFDSARGSFMVHPRPAKPRQSKRGQPVYVSATHPVRDGHIVHPSAYEFITRIEAGQVRANVIPERWAA